MLFRNKNHYMKDRHHHHPFFELELKLIPIEINIEENL
jgi:hypothetical protein